MRKYDLRVIDNAQIGILHPYTVCDTCKVQGIKGLRYSCIECHNLDLCYKCYHGDTHNLKHAFKRFDVASSIGIELPSRENQRKQILYGIFVEAKVVRGVNWEWGNQDGGPGQIGRVIDIKEWNDESYRSIATVHWFSGSTYMYRVGYKGICDIQAVEPSSGGSYYPDHLPILDQQMEDEMFGTSLNGTLSFDIEDEVQVSAFLKQIQEKPQGHESLNPETTEYRGTDRRDKAQSGSRNNRRPLQPNSLSNQPVPLRKTHNFVVGDLVTLINNADLVKSLQRGHGEWTDAMRNYLGKWGKVMKIYSNGDLGVKLDGQPWTLNPKCVRIMPENDGELAHNQSPGLQLYHRFNFLTNEESSSSKAILEPCIPKPTHEDRSEVVQDRVKDDPTSSGKDEQSSSERIRYLESKIAEIEESHMCNICMEKKRNIIFLCGHGTCNRCADTLKKCHMCRKTITKRIRIY
ncbi:hypothetical protein ABEB36_008180 [Hypothenemus hampei]